MYEAFIRADVWANRHIMGDRHNRTISENIGSKIGRALGTSKGTGTDIFHASLVVGGLVVGARLLHRYSRA